MKNLFLGIDKSVFLCYHIPIIFLNAVTGTKAGADLSESRSRCEPIFHPGHNSSLSSAAEHLLSVGFIGFSRYRDTHCLMRRSAGFLAGIRVVPWKLVFHLFF